MDNTPLDMNNSTPLFREPAAIATDKTKLKQYILLYNDVMNSLDST
jgi:hypothetical protein